MGVEGAVGFVDRGGEHWSEHHVLRSDTQAYLVIDCTKALFKLVQRHLNKNILPLSDSMVFLATFYRALIKRLQENKVTPVFVFNGGRKSETVFGPSVSGAGHFRHSCEVALEFATQGRRDRGQDLAELATNVLKEVISELKLKHVYQAAYEVYPTLQYCAHRFNCAVLTGHCDFAFVDVPVGWLWFDKIEFSIDSSAPISGRLHKHSELMSFYKLHYRHGAVLRAFSVLLRPDFHRRYFAVLNKLFQLRGELTMTKRTGDGKLKWRLFAIMEGVADNPNLDSLETVRTFLAENGRQFPELVDEFNATLDTYDHHYDFENCEFAHLFDGRAASNDPPNVPPGSFSAQIKADALHKALLERESSAEFLFQLTNTHFNRVRLEDFKLMRSTFSLQDAYRQLLLDNAMNPWQLELRLYDRRRASMQDRALYRRPGGKQLLESHRLLEIAHTSLKELDTLAKELTELQVSSDNAPHLALLMLLARYGFRLIGRENYDNEPAATASANKPPENYAELRESFYVALLNSFVYHAQGSQGDTSRSNMNCDVRVARERLLEMCGSAVVPESSDRFMRRMHLIEMLNSVLHAYNEINSLYNYPAPRVHAHKHYDAILMHRIMTASKTSVSFLLKLNENVQRRLDMGNN